MGPNVFRHDNIDPGMLFSCFLDQFRYVPGHVGAGLQKKRDDYDPIRLLPGAALQGVLRCGRDILEKSVFNMSVGAGLFDLFPELGDFADGYLREADKDDKFSLLLHTGEDPIGAVSVRPLEE